jgi:hypothetical protein
MTEVYWNLHKHCFSVRERGRVVAHTDQITLRNRRNMDPRPVLRSLIRRAVVRFTGRALGSKGRWRGL